MTHNLFCLNWISISHKNFLENYNLRSKEKKKNPFKLKIIIFLLFVTQNLNKTYVYILFRKSINLKWFLCTLKNLINIKSFAFIHKIGHIKAFFSTLFYFWEIEIWKPTTFHIFLWIFARFKQVFPSRKKIQFKRKVF